jgi:hypothetical protein
VAKRARLNGQDVNLLDVLTHPTQHRLVASAVLRATRYTAPAPLPVAPALAAPGSALEQLIAVLRARAGSSGGPSGFAPLDDPPGAEDVASEAGMGADGWAGAGLLALGAWWMLRGGMLVIGAVALGAGLVAWLTRAGQGVAATAPAPGQAPPRGTEGTSHAPPPVVAPPTPPPTPPKVDTVVVPTGVDPSRPSPLPWDQIRAALPRLDPGSWNVPQAGPYGGELTPTNMQILDTQLAALGFGSPASEAVREAWRRHATGQLYALANYYPPSALQAVSFVNDLYRLARGAQPLGRFVGGRYLVGVEL